MGADSEIMVVDREILLGKRPFQGFVPADGYDYESLILENYRYVPRSEAEDRPALKQPIAYCVIVNRSIGKIFAYRRAEGEGDYGEARLRGKWSLGIGGHIDRADLGAWPSNGSRGVSSGGFPTASNPIRASMLREIGEEVEIAGEFKPGIVGYINDDMDMVGKVHFGLLYRLDTGAGEIAPRSREIAEARMLDEAEWRDMLRRKDVVVEEWSRIASNPLLESL